MKISKGLKNQFEPSVVNRSSVLESLKFYCVLNHLYPYPVYFQTRLLDDYEAGFFYVPAIFIYFFFFGQGGG